jgi:hypothetical protein
MGVLKKPNRMKVYGKFDKKMVFEIFTRRTNAAGPIAALPGFRFKIGLPVKQNRGRAYLG